MTQELEIEAPLHVLRGEPWHTPRGRALREVVFGANDGLVTTLGFLAGLSGSIPSDRGIILIAGVAEVLAGALSMALGSYLSTKSQQEYFQKEIETEKREIEKYPEQEKQEIREIFTARGFSPEEVEMLVHRISSNNDLLLQFMLKEELGLIPEVFDNPLKSGFLMGISFVIGSVPPLLPYSLFSVRVALPISVILSILALFGFGIGKTYYTQRNWLKSGMEIASLGMIAAGVGYLGGWIVSILLKGIEQ